MGKINSRSKGATGEREFSKFLKGFGYEARRGQQFSGGTDSPDVVCEDLPFHWEVKRVQALNVEKAMQQARRDAEGGFKTPAVAHRRNGEPWKVTMDAEDFMRFMSRLYPAKAERAILDGLSGGSDELDNSEVFNI